ncbi:MAG TPA: hypothetical protein O0X01_04260 [Methanocorpusculum sp.]|nr:hypothetical protein [Methanocorpusculum sp.]
MAVNAYTTKIQPRLEEIKQWCLDGHTDKEIYDALGISAETYYKHKREQPEFSDALKQTKEIADNQVQDSLWKRANGYDTTEEKVTYDGDGCVIKREKTTKHIPPDPTSCIFWLKNRKPQEWRDKQEVEHSGEVEQTVIILPANSRLNNTEEK